LTPNKVVLIDECGDLGVGVRSSKFFLMCATVTDDVRTLRRLPRNIRYRFGTRYQLRSELKHHSAPEIVSSAILKEIYLKPVRIYWIAIDKKRSSWDSGKEIVIQLMVRLVADITVSERSNGFLFVVDRFSMKARDMETLTEVISTSARAADPQIDRLMVRYVDSINDPALQVHDFVVGSIFRSLERNDDTHLDIIKDKIVFGRIVTLHEISNRLWKD
jgi:hypothetical protein